MPKPMSSTSLHCDLLQVGTIKAQMSTGEQYHDSHIQCAAQVNHRYYWQLRPQKAEALLESCNPAFNPIFNDK